LHQTHALGSSQDTQQIDRKLDIVTVIRFNIIQVWNL
jgi:hypothetical protein